MTSELVDALRRAVDASPDDAELRLHLAELLSRAGSVDEAVGCVGVLLQQQPQHIRARQLMARLLTGDVPAAASPASPDFDWHAAEAEVRELIAPAFVDDGESGPESVDRYEVERPDLRLADVGGLDGVKDRLEASFLAPLRNPELRRLYSKSLRGGLLLYGPPGCGKTFLARALAGELGAGFLSIGVTDVLDPYIGVSERNLHEAFEAARRAAPCLLFLDELDGLGQRRGQSGNAAVRNTVNQLLVELDGVDTADEGVFVLAATNQPWDVDPALRRPGRLDRTVLVLPPDLAARRAIFRHHLERRPVSGVDLDDLARRSDGLTGADVAMVCEAASEAALLDSVRTGTARMIGQRDLLDALATTRPSIGPWLDSARNVAMFADDDGTYRDLRRYLKKMRRL